ncbi:MAG: rhomboid family intramembrane serine protease [Pirellulales bacterium]
MFDRTSLARRRGARPFLVASGDDRFEFLKNRTGSTSQHCTMRQAGTIPEQPDAVRFADYLFAHGIAAKVEPEADAWAVWVRDEEHVPRAITELDHFLANPGDTKYATAEHEAKARRAKLARREDEVRRNFVDMSRRWDGRGAGPAPLTIGLIVLSIAVAVFTRLGGFFGGADEATDPLINALGFTEAYRVIIDRVAAGETWHPLDAIRAGEVWRLVTPIFLHFSPWHLLFNMYMFYDFGRLIEGRRGTLKFGLLVLLIALTSNYGQYYFDTRWDPPYTSFGGMSGVIYGLFGYAWMKSRYEPTVEIFVHPNTVVLLILWFILCLVGVIGNIANWAHGVGLAVGMVIGIAPYAWRRMIKRFGRT